jgi:glucuronate isomerase
MIGVQRNVYEGGVHQGTDLFDQRTSLWQYRFLFNEKSKVRFPVSVLTHMQNQELTAFSWIFPNVLPCGHWWYSNTPSYIEADLRSRLEAVPAGKQIGYYSDAYKLEFVLPKFAMYRRCLARVLFREFVVGRGWSEERAFELGGAVLRDNVAEVFGGKAPE